MYSKNVCGSAVFANTELLQIAGVSKAINNVKSYLQKVSETDLDVLDRKSVV